MNTPPVPANEARRLKVLWQYEVLDSVPEYGCLVVSSSMPVRDLEWYGSNRDDLLVYSNRGANGIDGVTSTAIGIAIGWQQLLPTICVVGDVAFLHDTNALLGLAGRDAKVCIVVIDNDGGGIFSFLPQASELAPERFRVVDGLERSETGGADADRLERVLPLARAAPKGQTVRR